MEVPNWIRLKFMIQLTKLGIQVKQIPNHKKLFLICYFQIKIHSTAITKKIPKFVINGKTQHEFSSFCITGPSVPYHFDSSAMTGSPDGRGVLLFGGAIPDEDEDARDTILELRAGANSWTAILNITLQNGRRDHIVIPLL